MFSNVDGRKKEKKKGSHNTIREIGVKSISASAPWPNAKLKSKMLDVLNSEFPTTLLFFYILFLFSNR